jgi:PAS domain S-box-containing protein
MGLPRAWRRLIGSHNHTQSESQDGRSRDLAQRRALDHDYEGRRKLEAALRIALEFRAGVMEADTNAIAVLDADGRFVLANQRACEITGYNLDEFVGRNFQTLLPDTERLRVSEQISVTLTRGAPISGMETEILHKDGCTRIIRLSLQPLVLEDGRMGAVGIAEDITERRQAERALRISEELYRDLVENSGVLIGVHDMDGVILSANQTFVRFFGRKCAEELIGTSVGDLLVPAVRHLFPAYLDRIRTTGHDRGVMRVRAASGGESRILEYDNSVRSEGSSRPLVRCFGHDVTERERATRALRASETRYRVLYEDNPVMYFTVDPYGIILSVNRFGAEQLGYTTAELVGRSVLTVVHEEDRVDVVNHMRLCLRKPGAIAHWEFRKIRRDGTTFWVREAVRALTGPDGQTEVLIVCEDVTEHRRTEQALRDSEARLRALGDNVPNGAVFQLATEKGGTYSFPYMSAGIRRLASVYAEDVMRDGRRFFDRIVEEDRLRMQAALETSFRELSLLDVEVRVRALPHQVKWIHLRAAPRRLYERTVWDGVQIDVTDARRDLEALLQTVNAIVWEAEGDVYADSLPDAFISQQVERVLGYPSSSWLNQPNFWVEHIHSDDRARVICARHEGIANRKYYELEYRMTASDGRTLWLRDIVHVVAKDDERVRLRGVTVDVSAYKIAESALRESEERFRTLAETMPAAILIYRGDHWVYANPAAETVTGYAREELLSMNVWDLVHPQWRATVRERVELRRQGEPVPARGELRLLTRSGREHWIETIATTIVFQGEPAVLVTGFDITERARAEAELRESKEALRQSHERTRELAGKLMLAQEDERRRISRELHDDVNQKVAALAIAVSQLRQDLPDDSNAAVREQLTTLHGRMLSLSSDVHGLSHQLHPAALEHTGLIAAVKSHCAEFTRLEGITVSLSIQDGLESIPQEVALCLYRVMQESLRNIARHAQTRAACLTLAASPDGVVMSIEDAGAGFDLERVKEKGGLGLVSMEERVRLLRGIFQIATQPGRGTELHVYIPFSRE